MRRREGSRACLMYHTRHCQNFVVAILLATYETVHTHAGSNFIFEIVFQYKKANTIFYYNLVRQR
jgi:hypothetical protein